jgi:hypothetical protein
MLIVRVIAAGLIVTATICLFLTLLYFTVSWRSGL